MHATCASDKQGLERNDHVATLKTGVTNDGCQASGQAAWREAGRRRQLISSDLPMAGSARKWLVQPEFGWVTAKGNALDLTGQLRGLVKCTHHAYRYPTTKAGPREAVSLRCAVPHSCASAHSFAWSVPYGQAGTHLDLHGALVNCLGCLEAMQHLKPKDAGASSPSASPSWTVIHGVTDSTPSAMHAGLIILLHSALGARSVSLQPVAPAEDVRSRRGGVVRQLGYFPNCC